MGETIKQVFPLLVLMFSAFVISGFPLSGVSQSSIKYWDTLVLTQLWPPASCLVIESEHKGCNLSAAHALWYIHGLWPTKNGTTEPNYCNNSWPFDSKTLQVLQPRLGENWLSITKNEHPDELWSHEWVKHGTCGTSLYALRDELHYFNTTLNLHERFNVSQYFKDAGITPSEEKAYKAEDFIAAVRKRTGFSPMLMCVKEATNGKCYLAQIEVCLSKSFKLANCVHPHHLLFKPEIAIEGGKKSNDCDCASESVYYKPMPSVKRPPRM